MAGKQRPFDLQRAAIATLLLLTRQGGGPCPTKRELCDWTGLSRREIWPFLEAMQARGWIEIEETQLTDRRSRYPKQRRMRVKGGAWSWWTRRFKEPPEAELPSPEQTKTRKRTSS